MCVNVAAGEVIVVPAVWHYSFLTMALECQGTLALDYPSEVFRYKTIRIMEYGIQITHKHRDLFQAD